MFRLLIFFVIYGKAPFPLLLEVCLNNLVNVQIGEVRPWWLNLEQIRSEMKNWNTATRPSGVKKCVFWMSCVGKLSKIAFRFSSLYHRFMVLIVYRNDFRCDAMGKYQLKFCQHYSTQFCRIHTSQILLSPENIFSSQCYSWQFVPCVWLIQEPVTVSIWEYNTEAVWFLQSTRIKP